MIYFIVTTSIFVDSPNRQQQYTVAITKLKSLVQDIENCKIVIVENNENPDTFLNTLGCDVLYTNTNFLPIYNKGIKELIDVFKCIEYFNIKDEDFVIKMTGRYILDDNSQFIKELKNLHNTKYECIVRYGSCFEAASEKTKDCTSGLVGMLCVYLKQIQFPQEHECSEWKWGEVTYLIDDAKVCSLKELGIHICPGPYNTNYWLV